MSDFELQPTKTSRTRRNLMKMGGIGMAAVLARLMKPTPASAVCFLRGTIIRAVESDRKVEELAVGELLPTAFGGVRPIQWIGRYSYKRSDRSKPWVKDVLPIRIARSAFATDVPNADLFVTRRHALFIDGVLVPAENLINDTTITPYDAHEFDTLEFFHIKLESHDVIYAHGVPCETILAVTEEATDFAEHFRRDGAPTKYEPHCAPILRFSGGRSELKSRFRSAVSPWVDRRQTLDVIRDRLEERGIALAKDPELTF